mgnify:FL=1|tara:strand:- start:974 stop:2290 length:1317 start_codon:yes stop_codon:yes gene_type:complete
MENSFKDFHNNFETIYSWNLTFLQKAQVLYPKSVEELKNIILILKKEKKNFAIKTGKCSYDSKSISSQKSPIIISLKNFNKIKELNVEKNYICVESGIKISEIIESIFQKNISLYAIPGGEHVTIGGAIGGNVFGKDSKNSNTSFGDSIISLKIISYDGEVREINKENKDFFNFVGSFGFFGLILEAKIKTKQIISPNLEFSSLYLKNIEEVLNELDKQDSDYKYVQLDPFFRKSNFGLVFKASYHQNRKNLFKKRLFNSNFLERFFFKISSFFVNSLTWKIFYFLFFYLNKNKKKIINIHNFHYASKYKHMIPLICKGGLKEYEIIGKNNFKIIFDEIKNFIIFNKIIPIYIIMKKHFKSKNDFFYSFNDDGYSLAFAFSKSKFDLHKAKKFKEIVEKHNLRVNLTKTDDFRLNFDSFDKENIFISRYKEIIMENFK